jgi:hypothetical protein
MLDYDDDGVESGRSDRNQTLRMGKERYGSRKGGGRKIISSKFGR